MPTTNQRLEPQPSERVRSIKRLKAAIAKQALIREQREARKGRPGELEVAASARTADEHVAAREQWLKWVEEGEF